MTEGAVVLGVLNGLLFGLLGLGIVLVYKANRFLNLAYAQLGAVPAVVLAKLVIQWGWAWWAAFPVCVAAGIAIGVGVDRFFVSPLRRRSASAVAPLLLTVGVGEVLLAVTYIPALGASPNRLATVGYPPPFHAHATIGSVVLGGQDILTLILAPAIVGALAVWLRYSMLGKQIRAAASNPNAARLAGVRIARVSAITWGIAGALSAITAILQAPAQGTFNAATLGPELLLIALGAAAFGAFTSIPGALVGGLVLGLVQQITLGITSNGGTAEVVVVIAILAVVLVRGRAIAGVWGTGGAAAPMAPLRLPAAVADRWMVVRQRPLLAGTAAAVALLLPALPPLHAESRRFELTLIVMWALVGVSLVVLVGWAGQVSLGHFALVGIGAFVTARLGNDHVSLIVIVVAAAAAGALALLIVGLPALRVPGLSLAVTSIGLAVITPDWLLRQPWLGSTNAFATPVHPAAVIAGLGRPASEASAYYVALGLLTVTVAGLATLRRSRLGRAVIAVQDNEAAAATFGVTPAATRVSALAVSGAIAGAAGVVWALAWRSVAPTQFTPDLSISALAAPIIGGIASVSGAVAGAVALYAATFFASPHLTGLFGSFGHQIGFELAVGGAGVVLTVLWLPAGLAGAARRRWQQFLDYLAATATETANETATHEPPALAARDIRLAFGGVLALAGATIDVRPGEIVGLIGPNGAGKSTLMNVVSGALRADAGEVRLFGRVATDLPPEVRAGLGLGRSFQDARLFRDLTVIEAVQVALDRYHRAGAVSSALRLPWARQAEARSRQEAVDIVTRFGLDAWSDTLVSDLSTGTRRVCDVAMQVAGRPRLLLLDEPTAGVAQRDAESFGPLLRQVRDELDCAILVIEHDLPMLMGLCDRVYAMDGGRVIAEGTPDEVRNDPTVIATYLGTSGVAVGRSERRARKTR